MRIRMERVKTLLVETDLPLAAIAKRAGFNYIEYLNEAFKKRVGTTPGKYRKEASSGRSHAQPKSGRAGASSKRPRRRVN
jgi:LacI family transcriptional regulator